MSNEKKRFVAVGTGGRVPMFIDPIVRDYADHCEIVAFCDLSQVRMDYHRKRLARDYGYTGEIRTYRAGDFDRMLDELAPDAVIVCTKDAFHHEYVIRSLKKGCEVICEKPLTVDDEKCRAIFEAIEQTGGKVRVSFNYRWSPGVTKVRELAQSGAIGNIKHVDFEYLLDCSHGADYFRRWHSEKASSGGLLVHKSTHHFDLINWWVDGIPKTVYGVGDLVFYGKKNALARGQEALTQYERYADSPAAKENDPFFFDLENDQGRGLYRNAEAETGYIRDRNVFRDGIDIEDSMSLIVRYRDGVVLTYSLNAFCPKEGFRVAITGDGGRLEYEELHRSHFNAGFASHAEGTLRKLTVWPLFGQPYSPEIPELKGGHGGGDTLIQQQIFQPDPPADPFARTAGHEQGAASILIGIAANRSIKTGMPVQIDDLLKLKPGSTRLSELI